MATVFTDAYKMAKYQEKLLKKRAKNTYKAIKKVGTLCDQNAIYYADLTLESMKAHFADFVELAKDWGLDPEQQKLVSQNAWSKGWGKELNYLDSYNTIRGMSTDVSFVKMLNKSTHTCTVHAMSPYIMYFEYGAGDIGKEDWFKKNRDDAIAKGLPIKPFNSGPTIQNKNGINYWVYHNSYHFGNPVGHFIYDAIQETKELIRDNKSGRASVSSGVAGKNVIRDLKAIIIAEVIKDNEHK